MQPPPPLDFISTESVRQLYAAMPTVFARDIARAKGQLLPAQPMPTLKRERPADGPELAIKRRDTGESKAGTGMPPPATPALVPKSVPISSQPFPGGVPQGPMPDRTRLAQMRQQQAQFQAQAPPTQQVHVSAGVRQMSPAHGTNAGVGIGVGVGQPQGQGQAAAMQQQAVNNFERQAINSFGQQGLIFMQQLQDPNNAFVKYMVEQVPNFLAMPLPQQLENMQQAHVCLPLHLCIPTWLTRMSPVAHDSAETTGTAAIAAAATISTATTTIAAATAAATTTTAAAAAAATTTAAAAAATTTTTTVAAAAAAAATTTTSNAAAAAAAQPAATAAAKYGQSQPERAGRSRTIAAANDRPVTK